jgi:fluoride exporter
MNPLWIAAGGAAGVLLRWGIQQGWAAFIGLESAWATLLINFLGSTAMAWVMSSGGALTDAWRLALTTGLLGGFTTFSSYSWDALQFFSRGEWIKGLGYWLGSPVVGLLGAATILLLRSR